VFVDGVWVPLARNTAMTDISNEKQIRKLIENWPSLRFHLWAFLEAG
jgi:hypothetical protein